MRRRIMMFLCMGAISFLMGCRNDNVDGSEFTNTVDSTVEAIAEASAESKKEIEIFETNDPRILEVEKENAEEKNNDLESGDYSPSANGCEDVEGFIRERSSIPYDVAITANVKEVGEDSLLIRSTNDAFPGIFTLIHVRDAMNDRSADNLKDKYQELALKGGMYIRVLMESTNQKESENDNIPVYEAKEITILPDDKVSARVDIQLTKAPELSLTDFLSSQYACFSVQSGNYTWTVNEDGEEKQVIACGLAPLDEAAMQEKEKLKIPNYPTENVLYGYSTKIPPDILTVRQWDISELEKPEAKEERIVVYYDGMNCLELCRDKIYEFTAEWMKENFQQNQFYGRASYVVVTE